MRHPGRRRYHPTGHFNRVFSALRIPSQVFLVAVCATFPSCFQPTKARRAQDRIIEELKRERTLLLQKKLSGFYSLNSPPRSRSSSRNYGTGEVCDGLSSLLAARDSSLAFPVCWRLCVCAHLSIHQENTWRDGVLNAFGARENGTAADALPDSSTNASAVPPSPSPTAPAAPHSPAFVRKRTDSFSYSPALELVHGRPRTMSISRTPRHSSPLR